jgi:hypothetical protein
MLANFSQYAPQGLLPQFPQMIPGSFGQVGAYASPTPFGYDPRQLGAGQYPFGTVQPYLQSHGSAAHVTAQIAPYLAQLAQQIFVQNIVAQQIGAALYQLAQQLSVQSHGIAGLDSTQGWFAAGAYPMIGAGQTSALGTPFFGNPAFLGSPGGQPFVQHPFASANLQNPTWGTNRPTIQ